MKLVIVFLALLCILYVLATRCRGNHPQMDSLRGRSYAHRGLHGDGVPENSMKAFRLALEAGYGIELDIHLMQDGKLAVIHDSSLKRTAGVDVIVEELTESELSNFFLGGSEEKIPLLSQVLELYKGEAPLIVELKSWKGNHAQLCKAACELMEAYNGVYCMESFDPRCVAWLRKNRSDVIRGQLTENFFRSNSRLPWILKFVMKHQLLNFLTRPDFVAYRYSDRKTLSNFLCRKLWGMQGVSWTLCSQEELDAAVREGWIPIFEGFRP